MTSLSSALCSITLSASLALGSTVALAAPAEDAPAESPESTSTAEEKSEADEVSEEAKAKFRDKDYEASIALFQKAYDLDPQPKFLFNIGRVNEEAGNLEAAVEHYGKFVKLPGVDLDSREVALERLKVLREIVAQTAEPEDEPEDEPEEEIADPVPPPEPVDQDAQRKRKTMRGAGFGVLGGGAALMIGGAVVGVLAQGDQNSAGEVELPSDGQDLLASSQTKALTADILYGVGGALLLTGVILVAIGYSKPKTQRVALTPSFGPRGAGVDLRLRF